jgi:putative transposase
MSKPRPVYPGAVLLITRRIHKRQLLLKPERRLNRLIEYIVAVFAKRHGVRVHAICVMSNHWHAVCSDPLGRIVEFERDVHAFIARAVNAMHGEFESIWAREPSCRVACLNPADIIDKIAYTLANPVAAHLVAHGKNWPGLRRSWPDRPRTIERPTGFFRDEEAGGAWPETAQLELHRPPDHDHLSHDELASLLLDRVEERERAARDAAKAAGKTFLGRHGVLAQSRKAFATSSERRFAPRPTVSTRSRWARIERLQQDRAWLAAYRASRERLCAGDTQVRFPYGTWKLRVYYHAPCEEPPPLLRCTA